MARTFWKQKCRGTRRDGSPCTNWAMDYQTTCRMHGGSSPQAKHAAAVRRAIDKAGRKVKSSEAVLDPYTKRAQLNGRLLSLEDILWNKVESGDFEKADVAAYLKVAQEAGAGLDAQGRAALDEKRFALSAIQVKQAGALTKRAFAILVAEVKAALPPVTHKTLDQILQTGTPHAFKQAAKELEAGEHSETSGGLAQA